MHLDMCYLGYHIDSLLGVRGACVVQVWDTTAEQTGPRAAAIDALGSRLEAAGQACSRSVGEALEQLVQQAMDIGHLDPGQVGGKGGCWAVAAAGKLVASCVHGCCHHDLGILIHCPGW
jgi:hypothetical protein